MEKGFTLDEALGAFAELPSRETADALIAVATEYWLDGMIEYRTVEEAMDQVRRWHNDKPHTPPLFVTYVISDVANVETEDSGMAKIAYIGANTAAHSEDIPFEVRLNSWSECKLHPEVEKMHGKRVTVTIKVEG